MFLQVSEFIPPSRLNLTSSPSFYTTYSNTTNIVNGSSTTPTKVYASTSFSVTPIKSTYNELCFLFAQLSRSFFYSFFRSKLFRRFTSKHFTENHASRVTAKHLLSGNSSGMKLLTSFSKNIFLFFYINFPGKRGRHDILLLARTATARILQ